MCLFIDTKSKIWVREIEEKQKLIYSAPPNQGVDSSVEKKEPMAEI